MGIWSIIGSSWERSSAPSRWAAVLKDPMPLSEDLLATQPTSPRWPNRKPVDWDSSHRLACTIDARMGECVANVARAFLDFPGFLPADAQPVQGYWMIGGQLGLHAWIETSETIIDPTLAAEKNPALRSTSRHHPILRFTREQLRAHYGGVDRSPGTRLEFIVSEDDPEVKRLSHQLDPP